MSLLTLLLIVGVVLLLIAMIKAVFRALVAAVSAAIVAGILYLIVGNRTVAIGGTVLDGRALAGIAFLIVAVIVLLKG
ncbi:MAG: hypothetical protein DRN96_06145 [Thermoproteota archaeon]|nr:MAG: hypothetical protein DRN99_09735 [Candidatus Korarchaeota archaeon]RLG51093.1 MAG: hypothetical protein DRN96_06145 [Candidatus Korarchaeota archaeon]